MTSTDHVSNTPSSSNAYCDPSGRTAAPISPDEPNDSDSDAWFDEDEDDDPVLSALCERRLEELKRAAIKNANDLAKGHGEVRTISQDEFLPECCNSSEDSSSMSSEWVVVHFFHKDFQRCIIMDHHLKIVASQHTECKFLRIDAEKAPFFVKKLSIRILPTLLVMHHGVVADRLIGFTDLVPPASDESAQNGRYHSPGAQDEWKTSELQQWLSKCGAISYDKAKFDYENHSDDDEDEL